MLKHNLRAGLLPLAVEPLGGDGQRGAKLLGKERDAKFFEHPAVKDQLRIEDAQFFMLPGAIEVLV